jgi:FkbM family methyltransferase
VHTVLGPGRTHVRLGWQARLSLYDSAVSSRPFQSFAQNGEDVVLWRALGHLRTGRYVDVGANDPTDFSISRAFYDLGWSGITVEPVAQWMDLHRAQRPRDIQQQVAITDQAVEQVLLYEVTDTGLSTLEAGIADRHAHAGFASQQQVLVPARRLDDVLSESISPGEDIHFMTVDVEGAERAVINSVDLRKWRPWLLVIEATAPLSTVPTHQEWEPTVLEADYHFCLFDGLSRYYVAGEHRAELAPKVSYPACVLDDYVSPYQRAYEQAAAGLRTQLEQSEARNLRTEADRAVAEGELIRWRTQALSNWGDGVAREASQADYLREQIDAIHATLSWRVTKPLRAARRLRPAGGRAPQ